MSMTISMSFFPAEENKIKAFTSMIRRFLEGMEITEEVEQEFYYPEMVRRGYIDILNEI